MRKYNPRDFSHGEIAANRTDGDVAIKDVTIRADARGNGFLTQGSGNIVFDNTRIYIDSQGTNAPVIFAQTGNVTIKNSVVEVTCENIQHSKEATRFA